MGVVGLWVGAELRRRWRRHVVLALLIGLVGTVVLTCVAAARRTESAHDRWTTSHAIPQLEIYAGMPPEQLPSFVSDIRSVPGVERVGMWDALLAAPQLPDVFPGDVIVFAPADDAYTNTIDKPIVTAGRLPRRDATDEVFANELAAKSFDLHVGSKVKLWSIGDEESDAFQAGDLESIKGTGPTPTVRVVGIGRGRLDLYQSGYADEYFFASKGFRERYGDQMADYGAPLLDIRVDPGRVDKVAADLQPVVSAAIEGGEANRNDDRASGLVDAARVEAIALLLVALTALIAGAVTVSQAIGRSIADNAQDNTVLASIGIDRRGRARITATMFLVPAVVGAALAVMGAWIASRFFPTGVLRPVEISRGAQLDVRVFVVGALVIVLTVVAWAAFGAWRQRIGEASVRSARRSSWLDRATARLAPSTATGIRWAVGRRDGTRAHPRGALVAAIVSVAGLLAVFTYTAGIDHVVSTPAAYGWTFDAAIGGGEDPKPAMEARDQLVGMRGIDDVATVTYMSRVTVDDTRMQGWTYVDAQGHIGPAVVHGRAPTGDDEVLLGTKSASDLVAHIGDIVHARRADSSLVNLRVVGLGLFSTLDDDGFTEGMVATPATLKSLKGTVPMHGVVVTWDKGPAGEQARKELQESGMLAAEITPTSDITNLRVVRSYPRWLAGFLVALGLLASVHAFVVSSRRRRHEAGILRALGFSRRQLGHAVSTQGITVGVLAVVIGVPVGLLLGRWVWTTHADSIGIGTSVGSPILGLSIVAVVTIALMWCIAAASNRFVNRATLTESLRVE